MGPALAETHTIHPDPAEWFVRHGVPMDGARCVGGREVAMIGANELTGDAGMEAADQRDDRLRRQGEGPRGASGVPAVVIPPLC